MLREQHIYTTHKCQSVIINNSCSWSAKWRQWTCRGQFTFKRFSVIFGTVTNNIPDVLQKIPVQTWTGHRLQEVEAPRFQYNRHMKVAMLSTIPIGHPTSQVVWFDWFHKVPGLRHIEFASLRACHKWEECAVSCARRSVCFWNRNGKCASILAATFVLEWYIGNQNMSKILPRHSRDTGWSVLPILCRNGVWVGRGEHFASDTWWLLSRDRTVYETHAEGFH